MNEKKRQVENVIVKIYRPELTEEEQKKAEAKILVALQQFGKAMVEAERAVE